MDGCRFRMGKIQAVDCWMHPSLRFFLPDINALPYFFLMLAHIRKELILLLRMFQKSWHGPTHRILLAALQRTLLSLL